MLSYWLVHLSPLADRRSDGWPTWRLENHPHGLSIHCWLLGQPISFRTHHSLLFHLLLCEDYTSSERVTSHGGYQIVGRERRGRVSQLAWRGGGCFDSRHRVNSTVRRQPLRRCWECRTLCVL